MDTVAEILKAVFPDGPKPRIPDGKVRMSVAPLPEKQEESGKSASANLKNLVKQIESETGRSFDKWKKKIAKELEKEAAKEEEKARRGQRAKRKKEKPERPKIVSHYKPYKPVPVPAPSVPAAAVEPQPPMITPSIPEVVIPELTLDVAYRRRPIKDHPHALDHALVAMSLACQGAVVAMDVAYQSVLDRLRILNYIDSPDCYYQEETRLLTTLRQSLAKRGFIAVENKQIGITEAGQERVQQMLGETVEPKRVEPEPQPKIVEPEPKKTEPVESNENLELLQIAQEELETLDHTLMGLEASLLLAKSKMDSAKAEYEKLLKRQADIQGKKSALQTEILELKK
jgi:hypothetical protein